MAENRPIIIKKVKKVVQAAHGGQWKVAYSDFMTAMMAFFLLMWLLSMVVPEKRAGVEQYFKEFSIFDKAGSMDLRQGGSMIPDQTHPPASHGRLSGPERAALAAAALNPAVLKARLQKAVAAKLPEVKNLIHVNVTESGVRIEIIYDEKKPLFAKGSPELTEKGRDAVQVIGGELAELPNKIEVEGHTDALNYSGGRYTNWELSTERASAARVALQQGGLPAGHLARVSGFAATQPLYPNPADPRNRRISILVRNYVPSKNGPGLGGVLGKGAAVKPRQPNVAQEVNATIERMLSVESSAADRIPGAAAGRKAAGRMPAQGGRP